MVERLGAIALHGGRLVWEQCSAEAETPAARRIHLGLDGQASRVYILQSRKHINAVMHPPPLQIHPTTVFAISTSVPAVANSFNYSCKAFVCHFLQDSGVLPSPFFNATIPGDEYPENFVYERCAGEQSPNT